MDTLKNIGLLNEIWYIIYNFDKYSVLEYEVEKVMFVFIQKINNLKIITIIYFSKFVWNYKLR